MRTTKPARAVGLAADPAPAAPAETDLAQRVADLEAERRHLLAMVEILQDISGALNFVDILSTITRRLGETFGLDRCSTFLAEPGGNTARLVASYDLSLTRPEWALGYSFDIVVNGPSATPFEAPR